MKIFLQTFIFILLTFPILGQTKADFVTCLNLIFDQDEFEPAYASHETTQGRLVITSPELQESRIRSIANLKNCLTQDDFRSSNHDIKILKLGDLERLGIQREADLKIFLSGNENELSILLNTIIWNESQRYSWSYYLEKEGEEWEIKSHRLEKEMVKLPTW